MNFISNRYNILSLIYTQHRLQYNISIILFYQIISSYVLIIFSFIIMIIMFSNNSHILSFICSQKHLISHHMISLSLSSTIVWWSFTTYSECSWSYCCSRYMSPFISILLWYIRLSYTVYWHYAPPTSCFTIVHHHHRKLHMYYSYTQINKQTHLYIQTDRHIYTYKQTHLSIYPSIYFMYHIKNHPFYAS